jgi:hypothetical protein
MKKIIGYKFIEDNMKSKNGNHKWEIGKWYKHEGEIKLCCSGFHACRTPKQSFSYNYGNKWFIVEARGNIIDENDDKFVASEMRLIKEIPIIVIKKFALFCAKECVNNYNKKYPNDTRVSDCIKAVEDYLDGKITIDKLNAAASAARSAAESAESAAASAARSAESAESAAESAAASAAASAARSAAWSAAASAAASAQDKELLRLIKQSLNQGEKIE